MILDEITAEHRARCDAWMRENARPGDDDLDLAVACAMDLGLTSEADDWQIPIYLIQLAREILA